MATFPDPLLVDVTGTIPRQTYSGMVQFPEDIGLKPCMTFTPIRATYQNAKPARQSFIKNVVNIGKDASVGKTVCLLVPRGLQFPDAMNYESHESALVELLSKVTTTVGSEGRLPNISDAEATALIGQTPMIGSIIEQFRKTAVQSQQVTLNPGEFMLFRSPQPRIMTLTYKFLPKSALEQQAVADIIKTFRYHMYPEVGGDLNAYRFPDAWVIQFVNASNIIDFPEMMLTDMSTTFNPNTMSYHENGTPIEYDLTLTFKELVPISRTDVEAGY